MVLRKGGGSVWIIESRGAEPAAGRQYLASVSSRSSGGVSSPRGRSRLGPAHEGRVPTLPATSAHRSAGVLMIIPSWGRTCGVAEYTRLLSEELRKQGLAVELTTGRLDEVMPFVCRGDFAVAHFQFEYRLFDVPSVRALIHRLEQRGVRPIATMHDFFPGNTAANGLFRDAFRDVIVHSPRLREELFRLGVDRGCVHLIPMGCPQVALADEAATRAQLQVGRGPALGFFGFATPQKGIIELAVAARALRRSVFPDLRVFAFTAPAFFGAGYVGELAAAIRGAGLDEGFVLRSEYLPLPEVVNYLHAMDVNVLPYKEAAYVGTSSAVRVLMAAEKPIITTDIPYFEDLDGEVFKIPSADPGRIAEAVMYLMADPGKRCEMVARIREYVRVNSWSEVAKKHAALYRARGGASGLPAPWPAEPGAFFGPATGGRLPCVPPEVWERLVRRFGKRA